jgi:hypothetical protein
MYRKNDKYLVGLSNVRASSPAGFKPKKRMTKAKPIFGFAFFIFSLRKERQLSAIKNCPSLQSFTTCESPGPNLSFFKKGTCLKTSDHVSRPKAGLQHSIRTLDGILIPVP